MTDEEEFAARSRAPPDFKRLYERSRVSSNCVKY